MGLPERGKAGAAKVMKPRARHLRGHRTQCLPFRYHTAQIAANKGCQSHVAPPSLA